MLIMIRLHLEYATQAGSPNLVDCLEQIQRLATSRVMGFRHLPYAEQLRRLGLRYLSRLRLCREILAAYKMFTLELDLDPILFFIPLVRPGLSVLIPLSSAGS